MKSRRRRKSETTRSQPATHSKAAIANLLHNALAYHEAGQFALAEALYSQILEQQPNYADALHLMGILALQTGRADIAIDYISRAIARNPEMPDYHYNLGLAFSETRDLTQADKHFRTAITLKPDYGEAYNNLGNVVSEQGQLEKAASYYRKAIQLLPTNANAHNNLGTILQRMGKTDEAITHYRKATAIDPRNADSHYNLANALKALNRFSDATKEYREAIVLKPEFVDAHINLGLTLKGVGNLDAAIASYEQALRIESSSAELHNNLANALIGIGRTEEAITHYQEAIRLDPQYAEGYYNLGNALKELGNLAGARHCLQEAIALKPNFAAAHCNLSGVLREEGLVDESLSAAHRALELDPESAIAHSNLFITMHYSADFDAAAIFQEAREFNARHARPVMTVAPQYNNESSPERRLRIGYVSADLRQHPVGFFFLPVLANHDKDHFEIYCYSSVVKPDHFTERFHEYSDEWRHVAWVADAELAELINADSIDILVDLSGHTGGNRLLAFARRPAPIQVTGGGHYDTTGLDAMDYLLTDRFHTPPGSERYFSEELMLLPHCYNCYAPPEYAPSVTELPAINLGYVTFGCFNNLAKVTPTVISWWAKILKDLPGARIRLQTRGLEEPIVQSRYRSLFRSHGIVDHRVELEGKAPHEALLSRYGTVDVALDPFPYSGGLTTLEALWMGVPVITLTGQTFAGRHSTSHLSNVGLQEFVATTPQQYVAMATALARDSDRLQGIRGTLRSHMAASALCDAKGYTRDLETAYRQMWHKWCESRRT